MGLKKATLGQQIFLSIIGLISFSLGIVAAINIQQIKKDTTRYNVERLSRKDRAVAKSIEAIINYNMSIHVAFLDALKSIGHIHKLKLNIYDLDGRFIMSSDPAMLTDSNITTKIHKDHLYACFQSDQKKTEYEKAGYFGTYRILYKPDNKNLNSDKPVITNHPFCVLNVIYDKSTQNEITLKTNQQINNLK